MQKNSPKKKQWQSGWPLLLGLLLLSSSPSVLATTNVHVDGQFTVTGNTGLGTTSPTAKLEVVGDILADGYVYSETTDRKTHSFTNGIGWYRIIDRSAYGPGIWLLAGELRLAGFTQGGRATEALIHLTGGGPFDSANKNVINITRTSNYNASEFSKIRIGYRTGYQFVVDLYKWTGASITGIVELRGSDTLQLLSKPVFNPATPDLSSLEKAMGTLGIASPTFNQSFGIGGSSVGIGTEAPTARFHVDGDAKFEDAVYLLSPQGDISMGNYTNGLP